MLIKPSIVNLLPINTAIFLHRIVTKKEQKHSRNEANLTSCTRVSNYIPSLEPRLNLSTYSRTQKHILRFNHHNFKLVLSDQFGTRKVLVPPKVFHFTKIVTTTQKATYTAFRGKETNLRTSAKKCWAIKNSFPKQKIPSNKGMAITKEEN